ncbi:Protein of unknown function [Cotesia congregata]|uniref:Uncharacterized protein n=1 Tax=Cotesia congregata TaxID=51543 RepID=A0A8J2MEX7_COTCN|nr:Protein of unknown function [Cotesia congregata]
MVFIQDQAFPSSHYTPLLIVAVEKNDEELIDYLLNRKANLVDGSPYENENPLFIAAVNGDTKVFKELYHLGC